MSKITQPNGVILVSFEFPPRRLSKISDNIEKLAKFLSKQKVKTWVITFDDWRSDIEKINSYLSVHRIPYHVPNNISFLAMVMNLKNGYQSAIASLLQTQKIDILHLFDWPVLPALIPWKEKINTKMVFSILDLQFTRDPTSNPYNDGIKKIEKMGLEIFDKIIAPEEKIIPILDEHYNIKKNKVDVITLKDKKTNEKTFTLYQNLLNKPK